MKQSWASYCAWKKPGWWFTKPELLSRSPRESVRKVTRHKSRHTAAWVGGMAAAGLGSGFLLGFRAFDDATFAERKIGTTALVGAGAGAAAGYALSRIGKREKVVYQQE